MQCGQGGQGAGGGGGGTVTGGEGMVRGTKGTMECVTPTLKRFKVSSCEVVKFSMIFGTIKIVTLSHLKNSSRGEQEDSIILLN